MKMNLVSLTAFALAAIASTCSAVEDGKVTLVSDSRARACVVVPAEAPRHIKHAASELVRWTKELTGADIPLGAQAVDGYLPVKFVALPPDDATASRDSVERVKFDGFRISASERGVEIASKRPYGMVYAVYWLLNRHGGIWWCNPDSGTDLARRSDFKIPAGVTVRNPLPDRNPLGAGFPTVDEARRLREWNVRNGYTPRLRVRPGDDDSRSEGGNAAPNGFIRDNGLEAEVEIAGSLGDRVWKAETNETEITAEMARIRASGEDKKRLSDPGDRFVRMLAQSNLQMQKHPERFPLIGEKRHPTGTEFLRVRGDLVSNCCISDPSTREHLLASLRADRAARGMDVRACYSLMCDDNSQWCECPRCAKLLKSLGNLSNDDRASDLWWDFINWISPRLLEGDPLARVEVGIYLTYRQPPTRVKPICCDPERMSVLVCPHGRCYLHALTNAACKTNARYRAMLEAWCRYGFRVDTFEYHCQLPGKGNYAFIERAWVEDLKWYRAMNISHTAGGLWGCWVGYPGHKLLEKRSMYNFGAKARWQIINLSSRFTWDPDDDFETVRRDLLTAYYRASASEMLAYHALLEQAIYDVGICMCYGSSGLPFTVASSDVALMARARELLKAAEAKAGPDKELLRRIENDRQNFYRDWESAAQLASATVARQIFRATEEVRADGVLDEPTWQHATVSDDWRWEKTYNVDEAQIEPLVPRTRLLVAADDDNLHLAIVCEKSDGKVCDIGGKGSVWDAMEGSHLEFCLLAPSLNGEYYHVAISHAGKLYSALTTNPSQRDLKKPLAFTHAIRDEADCWTVEVTIPLAAVGKPAPGEVWKLCVFRHCVGPDGQMRSGTSTGFPLHWIERWEAFSFGEAGTLVSNGSFETAMPAPDKPWNGRNWKFRQPEVPSDWTYHHNGGDLDWRTGDAADGRRYIRVTPTNNQGGPEFLVTKNFPLYPPATKHLAVKFAARGLGKVLVYHFTKDALTPTEVTLDSADVWKRYSVQVPLNGTHPDNLVFRLQAPARSPIDFDDVSVTPVR